MSRARTTGLSAGEAVLGLVIEQPDHGFSLERRLGERFAAARFAYSTAYSALRRLQKDGLVRVVQTEDATAGEEVTYEATQAGVEHFRAWVRAPTDAQVSREELHAKIALCEPREEPRLIDAVHNEELAGIAELDRIRERMVSEARRASSRTLAQAHWSELMDRGVVHGEAAFWGGRTGRPRQQQPAGALRLKQSRRLSSACGPSLGASPSTTSSLRFAIPRVISSRWTTWRGIMCSTSMSR